MIKFALDHFTFGNDALRVINLVFSHRILPHMLTFINFQKFKFKSWPRWNHDRVVFDHFERLIVLLLSNIFNFCLFLRDNKGTLAFLTRLASIKNHLCVKVSFKLWNKIVYSLHIRQGSIQGKRYIIDGIPHVVDYHIQENSSVDNFIWQLNDPPLEEI